MVGNNNKHAIWALLLSLLALITTFQQQMAVPFYNLVTPNKIVLPWPPTKQPAGIFVWSVPSAKIFLEKAKYLTSWSEEKQLASHSPVSQW